MSLMTEQPKLQRSGERGSIIVMTAILMVLLFVMVGMCIDISRIYMVRAELQNAADAAALTAARELDSGTSGIDNAVTRALAIVNTQGFGKAGVNVATVSFAINLTGSYTLAYDTSNPAVNTNAAKALAADIRFVKVTTQSTSTVILFAVSALGSSHVEARDAVAGMSVGINGICDFFPAAVALADPSPTPGTLMTLNFNQGTGNGVTLADKDFAILEVPQINGNGTGETATLAAGLPNFCKALGDNINMTPSSNPNNGPRNSADGMNTRFNVYANGYGNALVPSTFPPDSNVQQGITFTQYVNRTAVTAPNPNAPGKDERRLLIAPVIAPGTYPAYTTNILKWGVFFLKTQSPAPNGNCSNTPGCGSLSVEYVGQSLAVGSGFYDPNGSSSSLTLPVLYK